MKITIETNSIQETAQVLALLNQLGIQGAVRVVNSGYPQPDEQNAIHTFKRKWLWAGSVRSGGKLDDQNIRDWAYE